MSTTNLGVTELVGSQDAKYITINEAFELFDLAMNSSLAVAMDGSQTLTDAQFQQNVAFNLTGSSGATTLNLPATFERKILINNQSDGTVTVQVTGGAGDAVVVPVGAKRALHSDGADVVDYGGDVDDGIDPLGIVTDATSARTAIISDQGAYILMTSSSACTFTIPPDTDLEFPLGTAITVEQRGTGQLTIVAGSGVTINSATLLTYRTTYSVACVIKTAADTWIATGDLNLS